MANIGILFATEPEIPDAILCRKSGQADALTIGNNDISVVVSGIGRELAGISARKLCEGFRPDYIISSGICGGTEKSLSVGDLLIATSVHYAGHEISLQNAQLGIVRSLLSGTRHREGKFQTFDYFVTSRAHVLDDVIGVDAETYGVAVETGNYGVPLTVVRAVSDIVSIHELSGETFIAARESLNAFFSGYFAFLKAH